MPTTTTPDHERLADQLLAETEANDGLAPVDLDRFYADQEIAQRDPFADGCPQVPIGLIGAMGECVFAELGIAEDWHRWHHDRPWRAELNRAYNDKAQRIINRRPLGEGLPDPTRQWPARKQLHDVFEARNVWHHESYWLMQSADSPDELRALLDRVEDRLDNLRAFVLPDDWDQEKARLTELGVRPPRYRAQRGPVTFATSVYGVENLLFLMMDEPALAERLRDCILGAMIGMADLLDEEAGGDPPRGFAFLDDNCCLLTPDLYAMFGQPILRAVFDKYSPDPGDSRYQHSDSSMGHLLPLLGELNMTGVNFGPTVGIDQIRQHMPRAVIHGVLAPFTFSRDERRNILLEFLRDYDQACATGRGLVFTTAGSVNNGSRLEALRLIMAAVQRYGRYD